jgi:very-short-patch-repair endonuclease
LENLLDDPEQLATGRAVEQVLGALRRAASHVPGFRIEERVVVGNFSFEKLAMVKDLQANLEALCGNSIVAALAGDVEAAGELRQAWEAGQIDPSYVDQMPAAAEFLIAPADSSQQSAIVMVARGQSGVVSGPPGTGKSQTITNLIGSLVAEGKSVLFVAQKRAALEVVKRRLEQVGLQHLVLDLHGQTKKADVMRQFGESFELIRSSAAVDAATLDTHFEERRRQLNEHVERLHHARAPSGMSVYELQAAVLGASAEAICAVRWQPKELVPLGSDQIHYLEGLLAEAGAHSKLFLRDEDAAWAGARLSSASAVLSALRSVQSLLAVDFARLGVAARAFSSESGIPTQSLREIGTAIRLGERASAATSSYPRELFDTDLSSLALAMSPARNAFTRIWASLVNSGYRRAKRQLQHLRVGRADAGTLLREVASALATATEWSSATRTGSRPAKLTSYPELQAAWDAFEANWAPLRALLAGDTEGATTRELERWVRELDLHKEDAYRLPRLWEIETELQKWNLGRLVSDLRERRIVAGLWAETLRYCYHQSCLEAAWLEDPQLAAFDGGYHNQVIKDFMSVDQRRTQIAAQRVRRAHAEKAIAVRNANPEQEAIVRDQAKRKARHKPIRTLIGEAPDVVTALRPCWMASPLAVSQLLAGGGRYFDVVIFDEASQVLPEDAVTSILRGRTVVVAGDEKQLPPTPFFASGVSDSELTREEAEPVEGFESVLEIMGKIFDPWDLTWHYRSLDERLIAFSNRHLYSDRLVTFPGVGLVEPVRFIEVQQTGGLDGQEESSSGEVVRVVEAILEHAEQRPQESLGVIAMGIKHMYRIEAQLARMRLEHPELDEFFASTQHKDERFFVKNLERVQGDERDAIILSVGYGKNRAGTLGLNFGPLTNAKMGHRRLNVAVTRAKRRMTVAASFNSGDMDPKRLNALGMKLVRSYLEYAAAGGNNLGERVQQPTAMNGFELSVMRALEAKGLSVIPQYGAGFYRLDFAVQHPMRKGRFVMAIECDGASYHSANTARDRDRLRQEHLELLGWRFCRIWSTDWFRNRAGETERVIRMYEEALRQADDEEHDGRRRVQPSAQPPPTSGQVVTLPDQAPAGPRRLRQPIDSYSVRELKALEAEIRRDDQLRTNEELIREMSDRLGYERLGPKIKARLGAIIDGRDVPAVRTSSPRSRHASYRRRTRRW